MDSDLKITVNCFNLKCTLECGQCFRWETLSENTYVGVIEDRVIKITQINNDLYIWSNKTENLKEVIINYFDLNTDYLNVEETIALIDKNISKSLELSSGIHILNQPVFETIISYIISANNNIKRISRSVNLISKKFGTKVEFDNNTYYLFPTLEQLKNATIDDLLSCGVGFRAKYIKNNLIKFIEDKDFVKSLSRLNTSNLEEKLTSLMGVGPKVAGCIMLFSFGRKEVFPVDVWVKRVMEKLYFKENTAMKKIKEYANVNFKDYAGIVQQHLFYNIRENNI